ncbi:MAG: AmmeMemoRadiSam system protein B [Bilophila sp.]
MPDRAPLVAGQFYPADPLALAAEVDTFLNAPAKTLVKKTPLLTLLPHAGYVFCGSVIGATLAEVQLPDRLILLGPNHSGQGAPLAVWPDGVWQTPLGNVPVDTALTTALTTAASDAGFRANTKAHLKEHSLEVLLPFLQRAAPPNLRITPICVSCQPDRLEGAAHALASAVRACTGETSGIPHSIGLIVSSDMNHYADKATTDTLDNLALAPLLALDPVRLFNTVAENRISMCGVLPATLGLFACALLGLTPHTGKARLVRHTTSAEACGDTARVVGYAGVYLS